MMGRKVFVLGGARSGKSGFAQEIVQRSGLPAVYVATAEALDDEMKRRIKRHRRDRPQDWPTIEAPYNMATKLQHAASQGHAVLVDCLAVYVSNEMLAAMHTYHDTLSVSQLAQVESVIMSDVRVALKALSEAELSVVVSNEVGLSVVPDTVLGRAYRDILGRTNQMAAAWADEVYFVVSGIPMILKAGANHS